jgi:hypothetical protein
VRERRSGGGKRGDGEERAEEPREAAWVTFEAARRRVEAQPPQGLLEETPMTSLVSLLVALALTLPFGSALADQETAPGQVKKEAGDQSAKDYAPVKSGLRSRCGEGEAPGQATEESSTRRE